MGRVVFSPFFRLSVSCQSYVGQQATGLLGCLTVVGQFLRTYSSRGLQLCSTTVVVGQIKTCSILNPVTFLLYTKH